MRSNDDFKALMFNFRALNLLCFPVALNLSTVDFSHSFFLDYEAIKELINILSFWHMSTDEQ